MDLDCIVSTQWGVWWGRTFSPTPPWELQSVFVDHFFYSPDSEPCEQHNRSLEPSKLTGGDVGWVMNMRTLYPEPGRPLLHFLAPFPGFWGLCFYQMLHLNGATVPNSSESWKYCRKGDPLPGPKTGLLSNIQKRTVWGDTQRKRCYWEGRRWENSREGNQESCFASWLAISGFMVMGLVSGLPLT